MSHARTVASALTMIVGTTIGVASSQSLASVLTLQDVIAARGNQIPGQAPGVTWGALNTPSVSNSGRVLFSGAIVGVPTANTLGIFSGTSAANTSVIIQSGTQAPGGPAGATMDLNGAANGLQATSAKIGADGEITFVSLMTGGGTVANVDNWGLFSGTVDSGFGMFFRRGSVIPGTGGATSSTAFSTGVGGFPKLSTGVGYFGTAMTGGDVVGTTNNDAIIGGVSGNLSIIARRGAAAPGISGGLFSSLQNPAMSVNSSSQLVFSNTLTGVPTTADGVIYRHTPGVGLELIAREGDAAPGTAGAVYSGAFLLVTNNFNNAGQVAFPVTLTGGDVVGTTNNSAVYVATPTGAQLAWRNGTAAPGTDGTFVSTNTFNLAFDNSGRVGLVATITGGTTTTASDSGLWYGAPGALALIAREGAAVPSINATFNNISNPRSNAIGQLVFTSSLLSSDAAITGKTALMAFDPQLGLFPIIYGGEQIEVAPGVFKTVSSFTSSAVNNGGGASFTLSDTGWLTLKITTTDSTDIIVRYAVPAPGAGALLAIAGGLIARRR